MASDEAAFLQRLQASADTDYAQTGAASEAEQAYDDDDEEDYDPSALMPESSYAEPSVAISQTSQTAHSPPTNGTPLQSPVENILKSPSQAPSLSTSTLQNPLPPKPPSPVKQPRTIGGFIVDDEDEEEESPFKQANGVSNSGLLGAARTSSTPQGSISQTPVNTAPSNIPISDIDQAQGVSIPASNSASAAAQESAPIPTPSVKDEDKAQFVSTPAEAQTSIPTTPSTFTQSRLPQDRVGILEDRIADDPRGDLDAWLSLINEYQKRNKIEDARATYDRFLDLFPTAAEQWVAYVRMEIDNNHLNQAEALFNRSLLQVLNVDLWSVYLDYIRRRNPTVTDTSGKARQTISQVYDFVLDHIGLDKDSGQIWKDWIDFVRSGPGTVGGTTWQDQQKMDLLRKGYQRAICIPTSVVSTLWKEYDVFEMGLNKTTGRKFLQEKSPSYMTARGANIALSNITKGLKRTMAPTLPPRPGFEGEAEYIEQVDIWKKWIGWEKEDPLVIKDEDLSAYKKRVLYTYKQAVMPLRFWPEMWYDAAEFCFQNGLDTEGNDFISRGLVANPESCLLTFKRAERLELNTTGEGKDGIKSKGDIVREPYDKLLDALYAILDKTKAREEQAIKRLEQTGANDKVQSPGPAKDDDEDDVKDQASQNAREEARKDQIQMIKNGYAVELHDLQKLISHTWITRMRAMRRIQGKGKIGEPIGGLRQAFTDARKRGRVLSDVYVASALMEWHCYKEETALRIFERGMKLFPTDEYFALEFLKHLIATNDGTNARAVFETTVNKLTQKPEHVQKTKPLFKFFHKYESQFGELGQIIKLEKRMADLFPEDPKLVLFKERFAEDRFDPISYRIVISPATQARPKALSGVVATVEAPQPSPKLAPSQIVNSPKRPLVSDDSDNERPRKLARGESPLAGAAGRKQQQQQQKRRLENITENGGRLPPAPLPQQIMGLLNILPSARHYNGPLLPPQVAIQLLRNVDLSRAKLGQPQMPPVQQYTPTPVLGQMPPYGYPPPPAGYGQPSYGYNYPPR
ncbi:MAG: mRNA 3'-end-processing protein rna14 [Bogoriella megaspora]|nr:MAG: mRNA 3'-end-processing protein rna14 [Bogoriella megaspora]